MRSVTITNKKSILIHLVFMCVLISVIFSGCGRSPEQDDLNAEGNRVEGNDSSELREVAPALKPEIRSVMINGQAWMAENLNVDVFRNGEPVPYARNSKDWLEAGQKEQPAWCYYETQEGLDTAYGRLYNYYAFIDPRGLAPEGWELPSNEDFEKLIKAFGGKKTAGAALKSVEGWDEGSTATNESGFGAEPAGMRNFVGAFRNRGGFGYFWSTNDRPNANAWHFNLNHKSSIGKMFYSQKGNGFSVRCIRPEFSEQQKGE